MRELSKRDMKSVSGGDGLGLNYGDVPGFFDQVPQGPQATFSSNNWSVTFGATTDGSAFGVGYTLAF